MNGLTDREQELVDEYVRGGMDYNAAVKIIGGGSVECIDLGDDGSDVDLDSLIEENGALAVRAINKALVGAVSGNVDNTVLQAAVRAVAMLEAHRSKGRGSDPEDDMLLWVAEVNRKERGEVDGE